MVGRTMPKTAKELGPLAVSKLTTPGLHAVGGVAGLALQVTPTGARSWTYRYRVAGKRRELGLGAYPAITLAKARQAAGDALATRLKAEDPIEQRRAGKSARAASVAAAWTFEQCAEGFIKAHEAGWKNAKHGQQWRNTLAQQANPVLGKLLVRDVELRHVLAVIEPIWTTTPETASRLRGRIEQVLDWAAARGMRDGLNPARWRGHLDKLLPRRSKVKKIEHFEALPVAEVGGFMERLRKVQGFSARCLELVVLTAVRSGEARGAVWSEFDLAGRLWLIPAERMKGGRPHRVPLSDAAMELIEALPRIEGTELLFPSPRGGKLSDMALTLTMRRMDLKAVPHGFRSTFRDWCGEHTNFSRDVAEMALAHAIENKVEASYRRGDAFEKRRKLMAEWASFVAIVQPTAEARVQAGGLVLSLVGKAKRRATA
jgi:integrase